MTTRRDFLTTSTAAATGAAALLSIPAVHAESRPAGDTLRVGLIGCGGRGTGAAAQALSADQNVKLVALGDMFKDRAEKCLRTLSGDENLAKKIDVKPELIYTGFDAYRKVIASNVDVVLLTAPPGFRPAHLAAAVEAGKHIFCEKPMAVDAPGVRSVIESTRKAKAKKISLVAGFCYRYQKLKREWVKRIHGGDIGNIVALHCIYHAGALWHEPRQKGWDDMTAQLRNWPYYTWLSGDHIVEQACHSLDKMAWVMRDETPVKAIGTGGRQSRTGEEFGHIFDHHSVVYEYKNGVKLFHSCRQQKGAKSEVSDFVYGTEGSAAVLHQETHKVEGKKPWTASARRQVNDNMYQNEHNELFASIRSGKFINDGDWMATSTMLAIMGRMATYTGQEITWEMAMNSKEDLMPPKLEFGVQLPMPPVAKPGITKFV